jgi:NADPH-dependent ferric siderophore reductase
MTSHTEDPLEAYSEMVTTHLNEGHADSVLFLVQVLAGRPSLTDAVALRIDRAGMDFRVGGDGGDAVQHLDFPAPVQHADEVQMAAIGLLNAARARAGGDDLTSFERQLLEMETISTFVTSVVRTEQVTPAVRQITLGGGDLVRFSPLAADTFLYVLLPPPGRNELTIDSTFTWAAYEDMPEADRPVGAYYTLRRWRPESHELDLHFVLHGDEGSGSAWAQRAKPGDPVALWGPREAFVPPAGTDHYLLVGDETGLPAIGAILESLAPGTAATVVVEVAGPEEQVPLPTRASVEIIWLHRLGAATGTTTALVDTVRQLAWPAGTVYAWGGAESRAITAVRKHVRNERGLPREAVSMTGYWRLGPHDAADDEF